MTDSPNGDPTSYRLGDSIDDYCTNCKGISGHNVSAMLNGQLHQVMCNVCLSAHKYRKGKGGRDKAKEHQKLLEEVMKGSPFAK